MDSQPLHQPLDTTTTTSTEHQPRDLTWLGMEDDRELVCRAREIAAQGHQSIPVKHDIVEP